MKLKQKNRKGICLNCGLGVGAHSTDKDCPPKAFWKTVPTTVAAGTYLRRDLRAEH